ncbi:MAG: hypothetical protein ACLR53_05405 [Evtepia gabavorous]
MRSPDQCGRRLGLWFRLQLNEDLVIQGSAYVIVGESQILQALDALFPDSAE